ncbi:MAG: alpha/beta fold hydrolase [Endozoicomonas sp.]
MAFCNVNGINLCYTDRGSGEPLVLLHGLGSCLGDWNEQVNDLSRHYRVIAVDLRGHGWSDKPESSYSVVLYARDVCCLLDCLGIDTAHIVGFSMGGMTAFQLAVDNPERLKSLVVINSGPAFPNDSWLSRFSIWLRLSTIQVFGMGALGWLIGRKLFPQKDQKHLYRQFIRQLKTNRKQDYIRALKSFLGWSVEERLSSIHCPVLIVAGEHDYTPVEYKRGYSRKLSNVRLAVIENSRHATPIDQPEQLNRVMMDFYQNLSVARMHKNKSFA